VLEVSEEFLPVPSVSRLSVNRAGSVKNIHSGKMMATYVLRGEKVCYLWQGKEKTPFPVKSLVYEAFHGKSGTAIHVADGNEMNCQIDNLVSSGSGEIIRPLLTNRQTFNEAKDQVWRGVFPNGDPLKKVRR